MVSNSVSFHLFSCTAPSSAPRDVSAEVLGSTLTRLTWNAPLPVDQNGMIRQYHISVTEMDTTREFTLISESQQYDLDFLLPHHTYQFSIAAVTVAAGPFSIPRTFVTAEEGMYFYMHEFMYLH